jgi:hypothetical protein
MKQLLMSFTISLLVVDLYTLSFAAGPYDQYLTGIDVEKVSGLKGIKEVPKNPSKGAGGDLNFADPDGKLVVMANFLPGDFYAKYKKQSGAFKSDVKGVGDEAFSGPPSGPEYVLVFRKGDHCVTLSSFFNIGGPASKPLMLTKEQLIALGKIVAERL